MKCFNFFAFDYNAVDLNNQKILCLPSIYQFERTGTNLDHPNDYGITMKNDTRILFSDSYLIKSYYIGIFQAKMYLFRPSDLAQSEPIDFFFQPNHKTEIPPPEFNQLKRTKAKTSDADLDQDKSSLLSESFLEILSIFFIVCSLHGSS